MYERRALQALTHLFHSLSLSLSRFFQNSVRLQGIATVARGDHVMFSSEVVGGHQKDDDDGDDDGDGDGDGASSSSSSSSSPPLSVLNTMIKTPLEHLFTG